MDTTISYKVSDKIFNIDYNKLVWLLLPTLLRRLGMVIWLGVLVWPIQQLYNTFKNNRNANLYRLTITPQVVYLQRLLNDRYDIALRRIRIDDAIYHDPTFIFTKVENKPKWIFRKSENAPIFLWTKAETMAGHADFNIEMPVDIGYQEPELRGIVDAYKLPGKTYSISRI